MGTAQNDGDADCGRSESEVLGFGLLLAELLPSVFSSLNCPVQVLVVVPAEVSVRAEHDCADCCKNQSIVPILYLLTSPYSPCLHNLGAPCCLARAALHVRTSLHELARYLRAARHQKYAMEVYVAFKTMDCTRCYLVQARVCMGCSCWVSCATKCFQQRMRQAVALDDISHT